MRQKICKFESTELGKGKCSICGYEYKGPPWPIRACPGKGKSRGLGDTIAKLTSAVGIKPCGGCSKRQKKLNEMFPYNKKS